jgi:hypothetical protein
VMNMPNRLPPIKSGWNSESDDKQQ